MELELKPYADKIIVQPIPDTQSEINGLYIARSDDDRIHKGTVISVGKGRVHNGHRHTMDLQVGDVVHYVDDATELGAERDGQIIIPEGKILVVQRPGALIPYWDKVLIEELPDDNVTKSGLIVETARGNGYERGRVVSAGPGILDSGQRLPMELKGGEEVLFSKFQGVELKLGPSQKTPLHIVREETVYAIVMEENK